MTTTEIIKEYLIENKCDGLFNSEGGCSCLIKELLPCHDCVGQTCKAGYIIKCKSECGSAHCLTPKKDEKCTQEMRDAQ